ncbi:PepSY domain-containing protein [Streptomyces fumanus]|uniref:PepSY domain-containing protein n=1 Tax=Streptomyces fumanus TaxID=67302 RepID=A0A919AQT1_9ACTN|nr:PepSY domain-containing protein [Streptomyces fumanus]GHF19895.1 hypothetical protein GCM10018772_51630 [Streptomyces fumanus]
MKRKAVIAAVTAAVLLGGGTATALAVAEDDDRAVPARVGAADAITAALRHTAGTAVSAELEDEDDGRPAAWEVDILAGDDTWHSVRIDPATGKVLGSRADDAEDDDPAGVRAALKRTSVTAAQAAASAKGTVTSVELDDDGRGGWEVETRSGDGADDD